MRDGNLDELQFRQYFFARQAALLLCLGRPADVVDLGLEFVRGFGALLDARSALPAGFRAAWTFGACVELASAAATAVQRADEEGSSSEDEGGDDDGSSDEGEGSSSASPVTRTQSAEHLPTPRAAEGMPRVPSSGQLASPPATSPRRDGLDWRLGAPAELRSLPEHRPLLSLLGMLYATARTCLCELAGMRGVGGEAPRVGVYVRGTHQCSPTATDHNASLYDQYMFPTGGQRGTWC